MREVMLTGLRSVYHSELRDIMVALSDSEVLGVDGLPSGTFKYMPSILLTRPPYQYLHLPSIHTLSCLGYATSTSTKEQGKETCYSGNYSPIAIVTALSKMIEKVVLHCPEGYQ